MFLLRTAWAILRAPSSKRAGLVVENLALRHQIEVLQRVRRRPRLQNRDRGFWIVLARFWKGWRNSLLQVQPETVIRWHRQGFRRYWTWKSRRENGRPRISREVRQLIRRMSRAKVPGSPNPEIVRGRRMRGRQLQVRVPGRARLPT